MVLNGTKIVDADLDDVKDPEVLERHPGLKRSSGHIGFLGHGTRVEFRNIRIKQL
ncbi:MAG: family 16 glycoside hydrolase [Bryobacteraceae bacterium]